MAKIDALLKLMIEHNASDLHVTSGSSPLLRIDGELEKIAYHELSEDEVKLLVMRFWASPQLKSSKLTLILILPMKLRVLPVSGPISIINTPGSGLHSA